MLRVHILREKPNPLRGGGGKPRVFKSARDSRVAWKGQRGYFNFSLSINSHKAEWYDKNFRLPEFGHNGDLKAGGPIIMYELTPMNEKKGGD
jgi:hypothetical protein